MSEELIRIFVREEIGRNLRRGEHTDAYPWNNADGGVSISYDPEEDSYLVTATLGDRQETTRKKSEEEAKHWARNTLDGFTRDDFSGIK